MLSRNEILRAYDKNKIAKSLEATAERFPHYTPEMCIEWVTCYLSVEYFINTYCFIYDSPSQRWIKFNLWSAQTRVLNTIIANDKIIILKARQVGISWLVLSYVLWEAIFRSPASALIMSKRDNESVSAIGKERLRGTFKRLPAWMKPNHIERDDAHTFALGYDGMNSSYIRALSTSSGDSYSANTAVIDEADLIPDLEKVLLSLEPTVNAGGKLVLISKPDRSNPMSYFKNIYRAAKTGLTDYAHAFIAWNEHPERDQDWYDRQIMTALETEGTLDSVYENYPANDKEALSQRALDARIPTVQVMACYDKRTPLDLPFKLPHTAIYEARNNRYSYVIGADTAEGLRTGDYSTAVVLNAVTGATAAVMRGKIAPDVHARYCLTLSNYYYSAPVLVERNNHGHSFINTANSLGLTLLTGLDAKAGWLNTKSSKVWLYDEAATVIRDMLVTIHDENLLDEIISIDKDKLSAPTGMHDDLAMAFVLAIYARRYAPNPHNKEKLSFNARDW